MTARLFARIFGFCDHGRPSHTYCAGCLIDLLEDARS